MLKRNLIKITILSLFICMLSACASINKGGHDSDIKAPKDIEYITNEELLHPSLTFPKPYKLNGCKYVNLELSSPNSGNYIISIGGVAVPGDGPGVPVFDFKSTLTEETKVYQVPVFDQPISYIDILKIAAFAKDSSEPVTGIIINIKNITPTNEKIRNDPTVDKVIFESRGEEDFKLTTGLEEWSDMTFDFIDLEGYKYLNMEIYSPNNTDGYINVDCWGNDKIIAQFIGHVPTEPIIFQAPMKSNKGVYDNTLEFICLCSNLFAGDVRVADVDIYIKKIWATNKKELVNGNDNAY